MAGTHNSGRKPMPSEWKIINGTATPREKHAYSASPPPPQDEPQMPDDISEEAQFKWLETTDLMRQMGTLSSAYSDLLRQKCETWDTYTRANKTLHKTPLVGVNKKTGAMKPNPLAVIAR